MTWVIGQAVSESFAIVATGQSFTRAASHVNGVATVFDPTFTELSGGFYRYSYVPAVAGRFEWVGTATNGTPVSINFVVLTLAQANPVQFLAGAAISIVSPMAANGDVDIYQGDDYDTDDVRGLIWNIPDAPDLTGAAVTLLINAGTEPYEAAGVVSNPGADIQTVLVDLHKDITSLLTKQPQPKYKLIAVLADGHIATIFTGRFLVTDDLIPVPEI